MKSVVKESLRMGEGSTRPVQASSVEVRLATSIDNDFGSGNRHEGIAELHQNVSEFIEGFVKDGNPRDFLHLAGVPLHAKGGDGTSFTLLRVEILNTTDICLLAPEADRDSTRFTKVPVESAGARRSISLIYYDGTRLVPLTLAEARSLA